MNAVVPMPAPQASSNAESAFNLAQRQATAMASSSLVPQQYRGRENIGNVLIAMQLANRIGADVMAVMQNLHVIQGRPSLSSSFLIATVNACGRFQPLRFEVDGDDPKAKSYRVRAYATDREAKERCEGTWITWPMVEAEGWSKKAGSKWLTMPEQMFKYRAAAFWARLYAPEVSQGIHTVEEVTDVWGSASVIPSAPADTANIKALEAELRGDPPPNRDDIPEDADEVHRRLSEASTLDELNDAADLIRELPIGEARDAMGELYARRGEELSQ